MDASCRFARSSDAFQSHEEERADSRSAGFPRDLSLATLNAARVEAIAKLPDRVVHLLTRINADQCVAEMGDQLATWGSRR